MSADLLRLILSIAGVGLILAIYFWERQKRINDSVHAVRREREFEEPPLVEPAEVEHETPLAEAPGPGQAEIETDAEAVTEESAWTEEVERVPPIPSFFMQPNPEAEQGDLAEELEQLDELVSEERETQAAKGEQIPLLFAAEEEEMTAKEIPAAPIKIVLINVKAHNGHFAGNDLLEAATAAGLEHGDMDIFHRINPSTATHKGHPLYSMASMVEPGTFPRVGLEEFSTPGLALFLQLPSRADDLAVFNEMLSTAESLAKQLDGELQDETHSVLTRQTIEHLREEIIEFQRQQRLAQKQS